MDSFDAGGVTGIVWRKVMPGKEGQAEGLMREFMALAKQMEGFLGSEIFPPIPGVQDAYVVLYRFDRGANLRKWLEGSRRQQLLDQMTGLLAEPAREFFFAHGRHQAGTASSVFAYRIRRDRESDFQDWRRRIIAEVRTWEGFLGTESFDALEGGEPEFIVVVRFDNRAHLDAWLNSDVRKAYMREMRDYVDRYAVRRIGTGFEGWFDVSGNKTPPARWRQALVILSALFPVIMIIRKILSPLFEVLPLPVAFLILLTADIAVLTYGVMPLYTRLMDFWLKPAVSLSPFQEFCGWAVMAGIISVTLLVFVALG